MGARGWSWSRTRTRTRTRKRSRSRGTGAGDGTGRCFGSFLFELFSKTSELLKGLIDVGGRVTLEDFDLLLGLLEGEDEALVVGLVKVDVDVKDLVLALFLESGDLEAVRAVLSFGVTQLPVRAQPTLTGTFTFARISAAG